MLKLRANVPFGGLQVWENGETNRQDPLIWDSDMPADLNMVLLEHPELVRAVIKELFEAGLSPAEIIESVLNSVDQDGPEES
jgi:hypothetical protein